MTHYTCPYCNIESTVCPHKPGYEKINCAECNKVIYILHSQWGPFVFKPDQLKIDKENGEIEIVDTQALNEIENDYSELRKFGITVEVPK